MELLLDKSKIDIYCSVIYKNNIPRLTCDKNISINFCFVSFLLFLYCRLHWYPILLQINTSFKNTRNYNHTNLNQRMNAAK